MKTLASICAATALVFCIATVTLWRELRIEQKANMELKTRSSNADTDGRVPATLPPTATISASTTQDAPARLPETPTQISIQPASAIVRERINQQNKMMANPEYRKLRIAQTRSMIERNYPDLAKELGLSEDEADKLFELLAENQIARAAELPPLDPNGAKDQVAIAESAQRQLAMRREQDEAIRTLLGGKYPQYQDYQQTLPARTRVMSTGRQLAQAGMPLTETQTQSLTTALVAEQRRQAWETQSTQRTMSVNPDDLDARIKSMEENLERNENSARRMIDAAAPYMSARQLAAYREQTEQQAALTRMNMKRLIEQERLKAQTQRSE